MLDVMVIMEKIMGTVTQVEFIGNHTNKLLCHLPFGSPCLKSWTREVYCVHELQKEISIFCFCLLKYNLFFLHVFIKMDN